MNRRITVLVERHTGAQMVEAWEPELSFTYDPSALLFEDALDLRPKLDFVQRLVRVTGDYLDEWLKARIAERAKEEKEKKVTT